MNSNLILTAILAVTFVCLVKETDGLKCYKCDSCNDPVDLKDAEVTDCDGVCVKGTVSGHFKRLCFPIWFLTRIKHLYVCGSLGLDSNGVTVDGCICNSDLCNRGSVDILSNQRNGGSVERLSLRFIVTIFVVMVLKTMVW